MSFLCLYPVSLMFFRSPMFFSLLIVLYGQCEGYGTFRFFEVSMRIFGWNRGKKIGTRVKYISLWIWRKGVVTIIKMASSNPCLLVFLSCMASLPALNPFLSVWPIKYGKNDSVWLSRSGHGFHLGSRRSQPPCYEGRWSSHVEEPIGGGTEAFCQSQHPLVSQVSEPPWKHIFQSQ